MSQQPESNAPISAYAFVERTLIPPADFVEAVLTVPGVRFAGRTVGSAVAFVAVDCDSIARLQDEVLPEIAAAGAGHTTWTMTLGEHTLVIGHAVKHGKQRRGALVRFSTSNPAALMSELTERVASLNDDEQAAAGFGVAASRTYGATTDVLLDLGAPDDDGLFAVLDRLDGLPSAAASDVLLASWTDNATWADE